MTEFETVSSVGLLPPSSEDFGAPEVPEKFADALGGLAVIPDVLGGDLAPFQPSAAGLPGSGRVGRPPQASREGHRSTARGNSFIACSGPAEGNCKYYTYGPDNLNDACSWGKNKCPKGVPSESEDKK